MSTVAPVTGGHRDVAWGRALELAWESFCGNTTPVGAGSPSSSTSRGSCG